MFEKMHTSCYETNKHISNLMANQSYKGMYEGSIINKALMFPSKNKGTHVKEKEIT
jgi:hypothetical protein